MCKGQFFIKCWPVQLYEFSGEWLTESLSCIMMKLACGVKSGEDPEEWLHQSPGASVGFGMPFL